MVRGSKPAAVCYLAMNENTLHPVSLQLLFVLWQYAVCSFTFNSKPNLVSHIACCYSKFKGSIHCLHSDRSLNSIGWKYLPAPAEVYVICEKVYSITIWRVPLCVWSDLHPFQCCELISCTLGLAWPENWEICRVCNTTIQSVWVAGKWNSHYGLVCSPAAHGGSDWCTDYDEVSL